MVYFEKPSNDKSRSNPMQRYNNLISEWVEKHRWDLQVMSGRNQFPPRQTKLQNCPKCGKKFTENHIQQCLYYTTYQEPLHKQIAVIINGSSFSVNGFVGENDFRSIFPTLVGQRTESPIILEGEPTIEWYVGADANNFRGSLQQHKLIENGQITNWVALEKLWAFTFHQSFKGYPPDYPVILSELDTSNKKTREKMIQTMFEIFNVPALYIERQAVLALKALGKETGLIVDLGKDQCRIVPIIKGRIIEENLGVMNLGGDDVTNYLQSLLIPQINKEFWSDSYQLYSTMNDIKKKYCFIVQQPKEENLDPSIMNSPLKRVENIFLPNGDSIALFDERFLAPEVLFQPDLIECSEPPLHKMILYTIDHFEEDIKSIFYRNIILSGGSSLFPGLIERIQFELTSLYPNEHLKIVAEPDRRFLAWRGASKITPQLFKSICIQKSEYLNNGPRVYDL